MKGEKMNYLMTIVCLLPLLGGAAKAQDKTPYLDINTQSDDKITFFETVGGDYVYVPTLFKQKFFCNSNSICTLQIFNQMTDQDVAQVQAVRNTGVNTLGLVAGMFPEIINLKEEQLSGLIAENAKNFVSMGNLALLENPYASSVFKAKAGDPQFLLNQYNGSGLGEFRVKYEINGLYRDYSVRIDSTQLYAALDSLKGRSLNFSDLKSALNPLLSKAKVFGYSAADAIVILAVYLKQNAMKSKANGTLETDPRKIAKLKEQQKSRSISIGESVLSVDMQCEVILPIQKDAKQLQKCEAKYD